MSQPPYYGPPADEPLDPQRGTWPPQPQQPQYGPPPQPWQPQPGYGPQPQYGQPQYGQQQYGQPQHAQPWTPVEPAPKPSNRGRLLVSAAAVVVLLAGGVVAYVAFSSSSSTGAASPKASVQKIVGDLNKSDLLGAFDDLAPGEREAFSGALTDEVTTLKKLDVLSPAADPKHVSGVMFDAQGLTFSSTTIPVNDHVQIVELTGGTITLNANAAQLPFTSDFIHAAFPNGLPASSTKTQTINITQQVQASGQPIRIATEKSGGNWYPSLFYTVADEAAGHRIPTAADAIPAAGSDSPSDAVRDEITALLGGDYTAAIKLLSPTEMAAVHDYAGLAVSNLPSGNSSGVIITSLDVNTQSISGGERVGLQRVALSIKGQQITVARNGDCYQLSVAGNTEQLCAATLVKTLLSELDNFASIAGGTGGFTGITTAQRQALTDLLGGLTSVGVDVSQSGGLWYVNPARTVLDLGTEVTGGLKGNDVIELIKLFSQLGS